MFFELDGNTKMQIKLFDNNYFNIKLNYYVLLLYLQFIKAKRMSRRI